MVLFMLSFLDVFSLLFPDQSSPDWKPCQRAVGRAHWCKNPLDRDVSIMGEVEEETLAAEETETGTVCDEHTFGMFSKLYLLSLQTARGSRPRHFH